MCIEGGYKTITPIELANVLAPLERGHITTRALRVYLACHALVAVREAAQRSHKVPTAKANRMVRYQIAELSKLTLLSQRTVKTELRTLKARNLVQFSAEAITFERMPCEGSERMLEAIAGRRAQSRPIPIPRPLLRFLAGNGRRSVIITSLVYVARGLTLGKLGEVRGVGTVKASWIAEATGLSLRAVKSARKSLIATGFISKDTASYQRKLNLDGAYFTVNLHWNPSVAARRMNSLPVLVRNSSASEHAFAPLVPKSCVSFAPPYKDKKTPSEFKNQKTHPERPGFCSQGTRMLPPTLSAVRTVDLRTPNRVLELHRQAIQRKLIGSSEHDRIQFVSAAARAVRVGTINPPGLFMETVRRGWWPRISQADEDAARKVIREIQFGSMPAPKVELQSEAFPSNDDARLAGHAFQVAMSRGLDPMVLIQKIRPKWTKHEFERAARQALAATR